ncbi:MAG: hypothetical protein KF893_21845 [Caldilineaceae bacterium]|nr:hypothetical protein [Caldilineaceae bacterium]
MALMSQSSYLLRFWRSANSEEWRVTLVNIEPDASEQHFTTVDDLLTYLRHSYLPSPSGTNFSTPPDPQEPCPDP